MDIENEIKLIYLQQTLLQSFSDCLCEGFHSLRSPAAVVVQPHHNFFFNHNLSKLANAVFYVHETPFAKVLWFTPLHWYFLLFLSHLDTLTLSICTLPYYNIKHAVRVSSVWVLFHLYEYPQFTYDSLDRHLSSLLHIIMHWYYEFTYRRTESKVSLVASQYAPLTNHKISLKHWTLFLSSLSARHVMHMHVTYPLQLPNHVKLQYLTTTSLGTQFHQNTSLSNKSAEAPPYHWNESGWEVASCSIVCSDEKKSLFVETVRGPWVLVKLERKESFSTLEL